MAGHQAAGLQPRQPQITAGQAVFGIIRLTSRGRLVVRQVHQMAQTALPTPQPLMERAALAATAARPETPGAVEMVPTARVEAAPEVASTPILPEQAGQAEQGFASS